MFLDVKNKITAFEKRKEIGKSQQPLCRMRIRKAINAFAKLSDAAGSRFVPMLIPKRDTSDNSLAPAFRIDLQIELTLSTIYFFQRA